MRPSLLFVLTVALLSAAPALAQSLIEERFGGAEVPTHDPIPQALYERVQAEIAENIAVLEGEGRLAARPAEPVRFGWPLRAADQLDFPGYYGVSNFVDHDAAYPGHLRDYMCARRTYDLDSGYNHKGTDYFAWPFAWYLMDHDLVEVVSVAAGTIVARQDGEQDRSCDFSGTGMWNAVYVRHDDGSVAWYGHLKAGSLTPKQVGETVAAGERLGVMGSSGFSTGPHLHLEIYGPDGQLVDPYEGACNPGVASLWAEQRPYFDSGINAALTHSRPPVFPSCPQQEIVNLKNAFAPGDTVHTAIYLRDQIQGQPGQVRLRAPNGSEAWAGNFSLNVAHYAASWWRWSFVFPQAAAQGTWRWEVTFAGSTHAHAFTIGTGTSVEGAVVEGVYLGSAYPNPARVAAHLPLRLDRPQHVRATVYDVLGRAVAVLHDGVLAAGEDHRLRLDGGALPAGRYVVEVEGEGFALRRALTLAR